MQIDDGFTKEEVEDEFREAERLRESEFRAAVYLQLAAERGLIILEQQKKIEELNKEIETFKKRISDMSDAYALYFQFGRPFW